MLKGKQRKSGNAGASLLTLAAAAMVSMQTPAAAQDEVVEEEEELVITGTRIPRPDYEFSNPVTSVTGETIQYSGITNVTDFLQDMPALVGSLDTGANSGDQGFIGSTGLNLLNLRNLGTQRTLVLVNGRRHVAAVPAAADIDTNTIPTDLIERVDVLTGGASAIYGADGVSGVVNFIMRDDFEGFRVRGQFGEADAGGAENYFGSATAGFNFAGGRGNIAVALETSHEGRLESLEREWLRRGARVVRNPDDFVGGVDDPNLPDFIALDDLRWFESGTGGAVDVDLDFVADFDGSTDAPWDGGTVFANPSIQSFTFQRGGSGTPTAGYGRDLIGETDRYALNLFGHFDITSNIRFFTEQKFVITEANSVGQPTFDLFLWIEPDNPFIPPNIAAAAAGNPLLVTRDNIDLGFRGEDITRETYRGVWGFEGDITDWLQYNASYTYGIVRTDNVATNNRFNDRFAAALDVIDADPGPGVVPVCRSDLFPAIEGFNTIWQGFASPTSFTPGPDSGCVPFNPFGENNSQAAIDWLMTDSLRKDRNTQEVASAYLVGETPNFELPGGPISYVVGAEWRRETSRSDPAIEDQLGLTFNNVILPNDDEYSVTEFFAEVSLPVFVDRPFFDRLTFNAAVRQSDYTSFGETTAWNYGFIWAPVEQIMFRGTQAEAVRVPNLGELFAPLGQTFAFINDPCDASAQASGTAFRVANCAAILTAAGVADPVNFVDDNFGVSIAGFLGGNPSLQEETGETTTLGIVLRPNFAPGLVLSADWYDITINNAINTPTAQNIANQCVDLPTIVNEFCDLIEREVGGPSAGTITSFTTIPVNVASFRTRGIDFTARYTLDPQRFGYERDIGTFTFNLVGNHLDTSEFVNLAGAAPDEDLGELGVPEWQVNFDLTWRYGPLIVNYGYNYFSETSRFSDTQMRAQPNDLAPPNLLWFDERSTHDLQARWEITDSVAVYGGVNNMFNQEPDPYLESWPVDPVGRFFYVGFTATIDSLGASLSR